MVQKSSNVPGFRTKLRQKIGQKYHPKIRPNFSPHPTQVPVILDNEPHCHLPLALAFPLLAFSDQQWSLGISGKFREIRISGKFPFRFPELLPWICCTNYCGQPLLETGIDIFDAWFFRTYSWAQQRRMRCDTKVWMQYQATKPHDSAQRSHTREP